MNILLIESTFSGGERGYHLAKALKAHGDNVYHLTNIPVFEANGWAFRVRERDGVPRMEVPNLRKVLPWKGVFLKILIESTHLILFFIWAVRNYSLIRNADVILCRGIHPFTDILAMFLKKITGKHLFFDVCDPFIDGLDIINVGTITKHAVKAIAVPLSRKIYGEVADGVITHTNSMKHILRRYTSEKKIHVVYNPIDVKTFYPMDEEEALSVALNIFPREVKDKFIVLYTGMIGPFQDLGRILSAAELLRDSKDILFMLVGEGEEKDRLVSEVKRKDLDNVLFLDYQSWNVMPYIINSADICVLPLRAHPLLQIALPKKFFEYAACGKPIICFCPEGEATELVKRWNAGVAVPPDDVEGFAREVKRLSLNNELVKEMGMNARKMVEAMFSPEKVGEELSRIFSKALSVDREVQDV